MAISNIIQLTKNLPVYTEKLTFNEDEFNVTENQIVTITRYKGGTSQSLITINGILSENLNLKIHSNWESLNSNSIFGTITEGLTTLSNAGELGLTSKTGGGGVSFIQPWNNRKFWAGTDPFPLNFSMTFFSQGNSKTDVFDPVIQLVSLCMPRETENVIEDVVSKIPLVNLNAPNVKGQSNLIKAITEAVETYSIPGPSLYFKGAGKSEGQGDATTIVIGNMFAFGGCYITDVEAEWSSTFDSQGYPIWCKVSVSAQAMDSNTVKSDGIWNTQQYRNNQAGLSKFLESAKTTITTFIDDFANVFKKSVDATPFIGGNSSV